MILFRASWGIVVFLIVSVPAYGGGDKKPASHGEGRLSHGDAVELSISFIGTNVSGELGTANLPRKLGELTQEQIRAGLTSAGNKKFNDQKIELPDDPESSVTLERVVVSPKDVVELKPGVEAQPPVLSRDPKTEAPKRNQNQIRGLQNESQEGVPSLPPKQVVVRMSSETADKLSKASPEDRRDFFEAVRKAADLAYRAQMADELVRKQMNEREQEAYLAERAKENIHGRGSSTSDSSNTVSRGLASVDMPQFVNERSPTMSRKPTTQDALRSFTSGGPSNPFAKAMSAEPSGNSTLLPSITDQKLLEAMIPFWQGSIDTWYSSSQKPLSMGIVNPSLKTKGSTAVVGRKKRVGKPLFKNGGAAGGDSEDSNGGSDDEDPGATIAAVRQAMFLQYLAAIIQRQLIEEKSQSEARSLASESASEGDSIVHKVSEKGQSVSEKLLLLASPMGSIKKNTLIRDIASSAGMSDFWGIFIYRFTYTLALIATAIFIYFVVSRIRRARSMAVRK